MKTYKMMDEVVCYCTNCKLELNHRITRVEAGRPKRVLCLTCNTERTYRKSEAAMATKTKKPSKRPLSAKATQEAGWQAKIDQRRENAKAYDMTQSYKLDEVIEHQLFGAGLVVGILPPDKISVFFQDGVKTMKCGRME
jgi:hypothetical protein